MSISRRAHSVELNSLSYSEIFLFAYRKLAIEAEQNMEAVNPPLFLRFINILINDAIFLLDEALSNMAQLRQMQNAM